MKKKLGKTMNLLLVMILMFAASCATLLALTTVTKAQTVKKTLINNAYLNVNVTSEVQETEIIWEVSYQKKPHNTQERCIKFHLENELTHTPADFIKENEWWVEKDFSKKGQGVFHITTPLKENVLVLSVQLDEKVLQTETEILTENILREEIAGPYEIKVATTLKDETATKTTEETTETTTDNLETSSTESQVKEIEDSYTLETASQEVSVDSPVITMSKPVLKIEAIDPFSYTTDSRGQYPTHETHQYLDEAVGSLTHDNVINYHYGNSENKEDSVALTNVLGTQDAFFNGYHEYEQASSLMHANTKLTVIPYESKENTYKVQLDTIGDAIRPYPLVDIVLVLDQSKSMEKDTRWDQLKQAVSDFSNAVLTDDYNVKLGMVTFGGEKVGKDYKHSARAAKFSDGYFTDNVNDITSHTVIKEPEYGYTPTFLGVEAGLNLLNKGRENAHKVLVTITDGLPTVYPTANFDYNSKKDVKETPGDNFDRFELTGKNWEREDDTDNPSNYKKTIDYLSGGGDFGEGLYKKYPNVYKAAAGFHMNSTGKEYEVLTSVGADSLVHADDTVSLAGALNNFLAPMIYTIARGQLVNPISEYVDYKDALESSRFLVDEEGQQITDDTNTNHHIVYEDNTVKADNITLGTKTIAGKVYREGLRICYDVQLKEDYVDGTFYPTNEMSVLTSIRQSLVEQTATKSELLEEERNLYYALPSIKAVGAVTNLTIKKEWQDDKNKWDTRQTIILQLQRQVAGQWEDVAGSQLVIEPSEKEEATAFFKDLPVKVAGETVSYRIVEKSQNDDRLENLYGYANVVYAPQEILASDITEATVLIATNTLLKTGFTFTKVGADGKTPLADVAFTLTDANGNEFKANSTTDGVVQFDGLPVGDYIMEETKTPEGYEPIVPLKITITQDEATKALIVTGLPDTHTIINELKAIDLRLIKKNQHTNQAISGAEFTVYDYQSGEISDESFVASGISDEKGSIYFSTKEGQAFYPELNHTYAIKETRAPAGFVLSEDLYLLTTSLDETGKPVVRVTLNGEELPDETEITVTLGEDKNSSVEWTVYNTPKGELPDTGGAGNTVYYQTALVFMSIALLSGMTYFYTKKKEVR